MSRPHALAWSDAAQRAITTELGRLVLGGRPARPELYVAAATYTRTPKRKPRTRAYLREEPTP